MAHVVRFKCRYQFYACHVMLNCICHAGKGSNPEWNESFVFTVSDRATELMIKLMDSDSGTADDFVGEATYVSCIHVCNYYCYIKLFIVFSQNICLEVNVLLLPPVFMLLCKLQWCYGKKNLVPYSTGSCRIPLEAVYTEGSIPPTAYNVVKGEHYCGAIKVGLTFTPEVDSEMLPLHLYFYWIIECGLNS